MPQNQQPSLCSPGQSEILKYSAALGNYATDGYSKFWLKKVFLDLLFPEQNVLMAKSYQASGMVFIWLQEEFLTLAVVVKAWSGSSVVNAAKLGSLSIPSPKYWGFIIGFCVFRLVLDIPPTFANKTPHATH